MFEIGIITKPQGVRGELRVFPTTDDPSRFTLLEGKEIFLHQNDTQRGYKLLQARLHKGLVLVKLEGVNDRNTAETLAKAIINIPDELAVSLEEGEYFVRDLIGLNVVTEDGEAVGVLSKVIHTNANDVYVIDQAEGDSFMIPAIKSVVLGVSLTDKRMTVHLIDGLRDLKI